MPSSSSSENDDDDDGGDTIIPGKMTVDFFPDLFALFRGKKNHSKKQTQKMRHKNTTHNNSYCDTSIDMCFEQSNNEYFDHFRNHSKNIPKK